jgi:NAD(P)-dependent dehydrogenase (short-subunit alcohol dehydrogenase family)
MGRAVIVTGGSGALGRAVVTRFLGGGDRVVVPWVVKRERDAIEAEEGKALAAAQLVLLEADIAEDAGARAVVAASSGAEVLVNGVGGFAGGQPLHETDLDVWDRMFRMNVRTAAAMSRAVLPDMLARGRGAIVNIASRAAIDRPAGLAAYAASKAALIALTEALQKEVQSRGVRVNAIVPTTIDTPANRAAMPAADFSLWTPPAKIAEVIFWLASEAATTVRGGLVPV